jgi:hypothetical protein
LSDRLQRAKSFKKICWSDQTKAQDTGFGRTTHDIIFGTIFFSNFMAKRIHKWVHGGKIGTFERDDTAKGGTDGYAQPI